MFTTISNTTYLSPVHPLSQGKDAAIELAHEYLQKYPKSLHWKVYLCFAKYIMIVYVCVLNISVFII